jgi:thermolysin
LAKFQDGSPETVALKFLDANTELFLIRNPEQEMKLKEIGTDIVGNKHVRFQQMYQGIPVFGRELIVHITPENIVKGVNGKLTPIKELKELPSTPTISAADAINSVINHDTKNKKETIYHAPEQVFLNENENPRLVWHITIEGVDRDLDGKEKPARWEYFVDSLSGEIVWRYNNEQTHSRTTGIGKGKYLGEATLNTIHDHTKNIYALVDQWVPGKSRVLTYNANNGMPPSSISEDSDNNWKSANQGPEVDCHIYTRVVFDYFLNMHGRNSYDNAGADMNIYVHCGNKWNNASWNGSYVKIGDGDGIEYDSFCTLDIVAHEWTHAVTEHSAGLIYFAESGALNESMSDVFAALIDGDWLQGEDNWLQKSIAPAGRNLADPTNGGKYNPADPIGSVLSGNQPDHINDKYTGSNDNGGVHINSGIMNKIAYLIANGGTHRGIKVCEGLGREVLGRIYYDVLTNNLTPSSDFSDMHDAVLDSLLNLYEGDPRYARWKASITNAFAAVGIGSPVKCSFMICPPLPGDCPPLPRICPPSPGIRCPPSPMESCPPSPRICPPSPMEGRCPPSPIRCPPSPTIHCPPDPISVCSPGPHIIDPYDPRKVEHLDPRIIERIKDIDISKISDLDVGKISLLKSKSISTVSEFAKATENDGQLKELSKSIGVSEEKMRNWRKEANDLIGSK